MECINPFRVKYQQDEETEVPCGKCIPCLKRRVSHWSFRLMQEEKVSSSAYFVTLTYAKLQKNENSKLSTISPNGFPTLCKRDAQLYFKRLRKLHKGRKSIKYYVVGEYGAQGLRPHYHAIIFNAKDTAITKAWSLKGEPIGHVHIGEVNVKSVGYTLEYITKGKWKPKHKRDDRAREFSCMSKGLGISYVYDKLNRKWHYADLENRMYCNIEEGKKIGMPRYYKNKLYDEQVRQSIGELSREKMLREKAKLIEKVGADAYYRRKSESIKDWFRRGGKSAKTTL